MHWDIEDKIRCDIHVWAGVNFSGEKKKVDIHAAGGRQGDELDGFAFQSIAVSGPHGLRVTVFSSVLEEGWQDSPWRAIELRKGKTFKTQGGRPAVQVPDLDWVMDKANPMRQDPDFLTSYPSSKGLDDRPDWTYGKVGGLKGKVVRIRVDRVDNDD